MKMMMIGCNNYLDDSVHEDIDLGEAFGYYPRWEWWKVQ